MSSARSGEDIDNKIHIIFESYDQSRRHPRRS